MKRVLFMLTFGLLAVLSARPVLAGTTFNMDSTSKGVLSVTTDEDVTNKLFKLKVENTSDPGQYYAYTIKTNSAFTVPLQLGDGTYKASVLQHKSGNSYKVVVSKTFDVKVTSPNDMYTYASPIINFNGDMESVKGYDKIFSDKVLKDPNPKITVLYEDVVKNYVYDMEKYKNLPKEYVPDIDDMYSKKKGICYDYAALVAGVLRSQNIPTRLCMGYAPDIEETHAWNEILIDGKWVTADTTYDAAYAQANRKYSMAKDTSKYKVIKTY